MKLFLKLQAWYKRFSCVHDWEKQEHHHYGKVAYKCRKCGKDSFVRF